MISNYVFYQGNIAVLNVIVISFGKKIKGAYQNWYKCSLGHRRKKVKDQKGEAEEGKREKAGKSLPAWILGFCEIYGISVNQENEELLLLLQVPEMFEYVMTGVVETMARKSFARR